MNREELEREINKYMMQLITVFSTGLTYENPFMKGGLEFSRIKRYVPGEDPAKNIDWRISAKGKGIFVREYAVLQKLSLFLIVDTSASMLYGTRKIRKNEYVAIIVGSLIKAATGTQINVGIGFSHPTKGLVNVIQPTMSPAIYSKTLQLILEGEYKGKFNFKKTLQTTVNTVDANCVLMVFSDFLNVGKDWKDELLTASQKFSGIMCLAIRDPTDESLPALSGKFHLRDPETGRSIIVEMEKLREKYREKMEEEEKMLREMIEKSGVVYKKVLTTQPFVNYIIQFITTRT